MPRTKEQSLELLADYLPLISRAIVSGVRDSFNYDRDRMHMLRMVSRRNNTRDTIADHLRLELSQLNNVRIDEQNQTTYFRFLGIYNGLVKKADECGDVALSKGQSAFDFQCNKDNLPDLVPEIENIYLAYAETGDPLNPIPMLISPSADGINWMEELPLPPANAVEITRIPVAPDDDGEDLIRIPQSKPDEEVAE